MLGQGDCSCAPSTPPTWRQSFVRPRVISNFYTAQVNFEQLILLPPTFRTLGIKPRTYCVPGRHSANRPVSSALSLCSQNRTLKHPFGCVLYFQLVSKFHSHRLHPTPTPRISFVPFFLWYLVEMTKQGLTTAAHSQWH